MTSDLAEGYVDVQVNGYVGVDFNDPSTAAEQLKVAAQAMLADGVATAFPTIITASEDAMLRCIQNLTNAIARYDDVRQVFGGIHLEGPFLSNQPGFVGAHPQQFAGKADLGLLERLCDACGGLLKLVTLAPEVDTRGELTAYCVSRGAVVSAGHTDASLEDLDRCIAAGLSLFTHLGNACPPQLDRHDNIVLRALARTQQLRFTVIADGHHVPGMLFSNLLRWIPLERLAVVSDAISAAGLGPGVYSLGDRSVRVGQDLAARDSSGQHFVGAATRMCEADVWLREQMQLPLKTRQQLLCDNPRIWFG